MGHQKMVTQRKEKVPKVTYIFVIEVYFLKKKDFIYLFMRERETEREREAETQAEGEAGSMQGAQRGTPSQVSGIRPWVEGRC